MNKKSEWRFDAALAAYNLNNYVVIDDPNFATTFFDGELYDSENPESIFMRKEHEQIIAEKYSILSDEAKQLIAIIFNTPDDIMDLISTPKTKAISKNKIFVMLKNQWSSMKGKDKRDAAKAAKNVIDEISDFTKNF